MENKLCQLVVMENDEATYIETVKGEVIINNIQSSPFDVHCEILQFNSQEDCDELKGLISIRNEIVSLSSQSAIRQDCFNYLVQLEGLENLQ